MDDRREPDEQSQPADEPPAEARLDTIPSRLYDLVEEIGRGGLGRVIRATDTRLGRSVAIKTLLPEHADLEPRFVQEARITARLEHPSIVPVHDVAGSRAGRRFTR